MIFDEFPIPLTFYDDKSKQNRFKENAGNTEIFDLLAVNYKLLPFQFRSDLGATLISLQIFTDEDVFVCNLKLSMILSEAVAGYQYFTWLGQEVFKLTDNSALNLVCGKFYLKANLNISDPLYSEVFTTIDDPDNFLILEWSNSNGDIDPVYYGSGYINRLYADTFITKGIPTIQINSEKDGFGNAVVISRSMIDNYDLSLEMAPNFIVEAANFISLHDTVNLRTKNNTRSGLIENVTIEQEQFDTLALWEVTVKFTQPKFYFNGSCPTPISPASNDIIIINTGTPAQNFDLVYDAN